MADARPPSPHQARGPRLPALERLAPIPDAAAVEAQVESRTKAGDVILELHGRGAWVTRAAIDHLRRSFAIETTALTRLVAEIVLRPPDLRHLDAAVSGIAVDARGTEGGLRSAIEATYSSRCPGCGNTVSATEFIWGAEASDPSRRHLDCPRCRETRAQRRPIPVDPDDIYRARSVDAGAARAWLRGRFPVPSGAHTLPDELVDLYPPRAQVALAAILERIETELRAPSIQAALRLAVVHMALAVSRLNGYPGRAASVRISGGHVRGSTSRHWRERNAWLAFEEGVRVVRTFVQRLGLDGHTPARVGPDLRALQDGSANVALRFGMPHGRETFGPPPRQGDEPGARPRVRPGVKLVLSQPPIHWSAENLAFAYLASALALGPEGAATLPLAALFESTPRGEWARDAASLQRALGAVQGVLLPDAQAVLMLERAGSEELVATVIGGVGAGLRVDDAVLAEREDGLSGIVQFGRPDAAGSDRDVAIRSASDPSAPFQISAVGTAIADIAVAVMQLRGEPTTFERILVEVLLGLDHLGHLRRLVGAPRLTADDERGERPAGFFGMVSDDPRAQPGREASAAQASDEPDDIDADDSLDDGPDATSSEVVRLSWTDAGPASDPVRLTLDIIRRELRRSDHPRLQELSEGLWWLRDGRDLAAARRPLSERLEWSIFSLLSTSGGISREAFEERVAHLFRGPEAVDAAIVEACLESYALDERTDDGLVRTGESLQARYREHGEVVGMLAEFAHRAGMRAWIARREQRRRYGGASLGDLLTEPEQRVYLPLVAPGPQETLEALDCIWYVRGKGAFLFDVEWQAALDEPVMRRGPRIETTDAIVRFLVIPDERTSLVRLRLERSPILRARLAADNWHILKWNNVRRLHASGAARLSALGPLLGLDPEVERSDDQMAMFAT
jgi:hypothetical protein